MLVIQEAATKVVAAEPIHLGGWVFMIVSVGFVTILMLWCFARVLRLPPDEMEKEERTAEEFHTA